MTIEITTQALAEVVPSPFKLKFEVLLSLVKSIQVCFKSQNYFLGAGAWFGGWLEKMGIKPSHPIS